MARRCSRSLAALLAALVVASLAVVARPAPPAAAAPPAPGDVSTVAGGGAYAHVGSPTATLEVGTTLYVADWDGTILARDLLTGRQTRFAGLTSGGFDPDGGPAATTALGTVQALAADAAGNLYVAVSSWPNCAIRRIDATPPHLVSTLVGVGGSCDYSGDGTASTAGIWGPTTVAVDAAGANVYFASWGSGLYHVDVAADTVTTIAGNGAYAPDDAPSASDARFGGTFSIALDAAGNIYALDQVDNAIRRIAADLGSVTTVVGDAVNGDLGPGFADGPLTSAQFDLRPWLQDTYENATFTLAGDGALLVFDSGNQLLRRIDLDAQTVTTVAGQAGVRGRDGDDGSALGASLDGVRPFNAPDAAGFFFATSGFFPGSWENNLRRIDSLTGTIHNAKPTAYVGDGGPATDAVLNQPIDVVRVGNDLLVAEQFGHRIRRIDLTTGIISTYAGTGTPWATTDPVPAATSPIAGPRALAWDGSGILVVGMDAMVRRIDHETGLMTWVAGQPGVPGYVDGPVETARFSMGVSGVAVDAAGRIYVADTDNLALRCIGCDGPGIVSTVAGLTPDHPDFKTVAECDPDPGDDEASAALCPPMPDGVARDTRLAYPGRVTIDPDGDVVFGELLGGVVRRLTPEGNLVTIAGVLGDFSRSGNDGDPATAVSIAGPAGLRYDAAGGLYIGEVGGNLLDVINSNVPALVAFQPGITRVLPNGTIERFAGAGLRFPPDAPIEGPRQQATFLFPTAFAPDAGTHLYVADLMNNRIRRIEGVKPDLAASASGGPFVAREAGRVVAKVQNLGSGYATGPIQVQVELPPGLRFVGVASAHGLLGSNSSWLCEQHGQLVDCTLASNVAPGGSLQLDLDVYADGSTTGAIAVTVQTSSDSDDADISSKVYVLGTVIEQPAEPAPTPTPDPASGNGGFTMVGGDGGTFAFGDTPWPGRLPGGMPIIDAIGGPDDSGHPSDVAAMQSFRGILRGLQADGGVVTAGGGVAAASDEKPTGLAGVPLRAPVVGLAPAAGAGYRIAAADGGVFAFEGASFHGSLGGLVLNAPIVGISGTAGGYRLVAADGGVFAFGDASFHGSLGGLVLNAPIVGIVDTPTGAGYWLVASDGGVFAFGDAVFHGSTGALTLNAPIVDLVPTATGDGYWLIAADGGVFAFGAAPYLGSLAHLPLNAPIVAAG